MHTICRKRDPWFLLEHTFLTRRHYLWQAKKKRKKKWSKNVENIILNNIHRIHFQTRSVRQIISENVIRENIDREIYY